MANLQTLLQEKEAECAALAAQLSDAQTQQEGWEAELFNQLAQVRDAEHVIARKKVFVPYIEDMFADLEARLSSKEEVSRLAAADVAQKSNFC